MVRKVADIQVRVFKPGSPNSPVTTIPAEDIGSFQVDERISDAKDSGSLTLENTDGQVGEITAGDKIKVDTRLVGEPSLTTRFTGLARSPTDILRGGNIQRRQIDLVDFVFGVLSDRLVFDSFESAQVAGSPDAILNTILRQEAPEIGRSQIPSFSRDTDLFLDGRSLFDVVTEDLSAIGNALVTQDEEDIIFEPLDTVQSVTTISPADLFAPIQVERNDDNLKNVIRVSGGTDFRLDDSQNTQSSLQTVTSGSRITQSVQTRKSEIDRVKIFTSPNNNNESLRVRIQSSQGGSAIAPSDPTSDIASVTLQKDELTQSGFTTFVFPSHTLGPNDNPFLIVETTGTQGHDVGTDGNGNLTFRSFFSFPVLTRSSDSQSVSEFRRRDRRIEDESLSSFTAVRDKSQSLLDRRAQPEVTVQAEAGAIKAHNLSPGDGITLQEFNPVDLSGDFLVRERSTSFVGKELRTELTFERAKTI
jgi:hypothetical protein